MEAIVFAAGRGRRLRPLTDSRPKPLIEVVGETLIRRTLRSVRALPIDRITIVIGYRGEMIRRHVGSTLEDVPVRYVRQDPPLGIAHAVSTVSTAIDIDPNQRYLFVNGDNLIDCSLQPVVTVDSDSTIDGVLVLDRFRRNDAERASMCQLRPDGTVRAISDHSSSQTGSGYVVAGIGLYGPEIFTACSTVDRDRTDEFRLADALEYLLSNGYRYRGIELSGWHLNVNSSADLDRARSYYNTRK